MGFAAIYGFSFVFVFDNGKFFWRAVHGIQVLFFDLCGIGTMREDGAEIFVIHQGDNERPLRVRHNPSRAFFFGQEQRCLVCREGLQVFQFFAQFVQVGQVLNAGVGVEVGEVFGLFFGVARGKRGVAGEGDK